MRKKIWFFFIRNIPEGQLLPWWALTIRAILFPLDSLFWKISKRTGYQWQSDCWIINGIKYSSKALNTLAKSNGELYRFNRSGDTITVEMVSNMVKPECFGSNPSYQERAENDCNTCKLQNECLARCIHEPGPWFMRECGMGKIWYCKKCGICLDLI